MPLVEDENVIITKAITISSTYFIFRGNGEEIIIKGNTDGTVTTTHKLTIIEVEYLHEYYPFLFKNKE